MSMIKVDLMSVVNGDTENPQHNIFGYLHEGSDSSESINNFIDAFIAGPVAAIRTIVTTTTVFVKVSVEQLNVDGVAIERILTSGNTGNNNEVYNARFDAWGFSYDRSTTGQRSGAKRFGAVPQSWVLNGQPSSGARLTSLNAVAAELADTVVGSDSIVWVPIILKRPPAPENLWLYAPIAGVRYIRVTSQGSRKR